MAYIPNEWKDQVVQRPKTYQMNNNDDGSVTLIDSFGLVTELGTPVNQDYMNHIEEGIAGCAIRLYNTTEIFTLNEWVKDGDKLYKSLQGNNFGHATSETDWWEEVSIGGAGLPVGTIFAHTANASFVPENSLPCDGTEYTQAQFPTFYNDWLVGARLNTCTYEEYQAEITATGECLKIALDTINQKFKVPTKLNQVLATNNPIPVKGNDIGLGINYDTGEGTLISHLGAISGGYGVCAIGTPFGSNVGDTGATLTGPEDFGTFLGITTDSSKSGIETDPTNTTFKDIRFFIVVATGTINQSQMDWSEWASSLAGKANIDANNFSVAGKAEITGWGFPSDRYDDLGTPIDMQTYVAPADGWYSAIGEVTQSNGNVQMVNITKNLGSTSFREGNNNFISCNIKVSKNDVMRFSGTFRVTGSPPSNVNYGFRFIYTEGAK